MFIIYEYITIHHTYIKRIQLNAYIRYFKEKHILKFQIKDEAKIKLLDTGHVFSGFISRISNSPRDKNESLGPVGRKASGYSGITVFEVEVSFDDPLFEYKFGFNTLVTFSKKNL